jgi:hypothetical protein
VSKTDKDINVTVPVIDRLAWPIVKLRARTSPVTMTTRRRRTPAGLTSRAQLIATTARKQIIVDKLPRRTKLPLEHRTILSYYSHVLRMHTSTNGFYLMLFQCENILRFLYRDTIAMLSSCGFYKAVTRVLTGFYRILQLLLS